MLTCYYCSAKFKVISEILNHLKNVCPKFSYTMRVRCGEFGCFRIFDSLQSLRMHYKRTHNAVTKFVSSNYDSMYDEDATSFVLSAEQEMPVENSSSTMANVNKEIVNNSEDETAVAVIKRTASCNKTDQVTCDDQIGENILTRDLATIVSSLLSDPIIPRKNAQTLVKHFSIFLTSSLTLTLQEWYNNGIYENNPPDIESILSTIRDSVANFSSEYKRNRYYKEKGTLIFPRQYPIIPRNVQFSRGSRKHVVGTGQFISIREVLTKFLSVPGVFAAIEEYISDCMSSSSITNIICSPVWKVNNTLNCNEKIYPLLLYYDEFETGNPLSSHAGIHKLGAVYTSIACLPPFLSSQIKFIFLFALFHYSDRLNKSGNEAAFRVIIDELNYLSKTGITLNISEFQGTIKFKVAAITGDNLGLHSILGFVESFNANYPCRMCRARKDKCQQMCSEDISLLRNEDNYLSDIQTNNCNITGVRHKAIWYELDNFQLFEQVAVDVMHDILEGVAKYTMELVINSLLSKKYFNIQELNERANTFDYGPDSNNKPPLLSSESTFKIKWKMSSIEALNYIRYFSCLVSHKVPDDDEHWHLYILLKRVLDFAMTDSVNTTVCNQLQCAVEKFNALYLKLSSASLKPKFHHLIHYSRIMQKLGPLRNLWCMRFESKHKPLKTAAKSSASRINICKTLALKHQLQLNHFFLQNRLLFDFAYSSKIRKVNSTHLTLLVNQLHLSPLIELYITSFVKINGIKYRPNDVLALHFDEQYGDPVFFNILKIFVCLIEKKAFFEGYLFETVTFDPHVYAYLVQRTDHQYFVSYDSLIFVHPNTISTLPPYGFCYITIRNSFD